MAGDGGVPLTSIEDYAFNGCDSFADLELPDGLTSIGQHAFEECTPGRFLPGTPRVGSGACAITIPLPS